MLAERNGKGGRQSKFCLKVEMAQKQSIWHYQPSKSCTFLRIVVATPNLVTQARSAIAHPQTALCIPLVITEIPIIAYTKQLVACCRRYDRRTPGIIGAHTELRPSQCTRAHAYDAALDARQPHKERVACAGMLETGFQIDSLHRAQSFTTYESHVLFALRFMIDCSISGGNWVELRAGAYKLLSPDDPRKQSHCQLEAHINYTDITSHPAEGRLRLPSHL